MSTERELPAPAERLRSVDTIGGVTLMVVALAALAAAQALPGMSRGEFGAGTAPRIAGGALFALGGVIALQGMFRGAERIGAFHLRPLVFVTAAVVFFALFIRDFGMVLTSPATILLASLASAETRWPHIVLWALLLSALCIGLFVYALALPLPLWPR